MNITAGFILVLAKSTTNTLLVANPQFVHPLMDTAFEDTSDINIDPSPVKKKLLTFPKYKIEERFIDKIPEQLKENIIGAVCELSKKLEKIGLLLESINSNGDYLTKAIYSVPSTTNKHVVIAINNKGQNDNWSISSIRIEQSVYDHQDEIYAEIESLFTADQESKTTLDSDFPNDFENPFIKNGILS